MRSRLILALLLLVLLPGAARPGLAQPMLGAAEQRAFDLRALQSYLMVMALRCGRHDDYNRFVLRFRGELAGAYRSIEAFFRRAHGSQAQRRLDTYITSLANQHSQDGMAVGSGFCQWSAPLWPAVMAAPDAAGLAALTAQARLSTQVEEVLAGAPRGAIRSAAR
jgi:hypothetical protein